MFDITVKTTSNVTENLLSILIYRFHYPCFRYRRIQKIAEHSENPASVFRDLPSLAVRFIFRFSQKLNMTLSVKLLLSLKSLCYGKYAPFMLLTTSEPKKEHKLLKMENFHIACRNNHVHTVSRVYFL